MYWHIISPSFWYFLFSKDLFGCAILTHCTSFLSSHSLSDIHTLFIEVFYTIPKHKIKHYIHIFIHLYRYLYILFYREVSIFKIQKGAFIASVCTMEFVTKYLIIDIYQFKISISIIFLIILIKITYAKKKKSGMGQSEQCMILLVSSQRTGIGV